MRSNKIIVLGLLAIVFFIFWGCSRAIEDKEDFSEIVKISLRNVGNQLLLSNQDGKSLVLPVVALDKSKFELSFESELSIRPENLVAIIKKSFLKAALPDKYRVEVKQCLDEEVAYSYQIQKDSEKDIIPCSGRSLPPNCYTIEVRFMHVKATIFATQVPLYVAILVFLGLLIALLYRKKKTEVVLMEEEESPASAYTIIGSFHFYQEQSKLV
ncbi:MAG: hypothetical protein ACI81G_001757, partial [Gammaproteobacteria bacterium]